MLRHLFHFDFALKAIFLLILFILLRDGFMRLKLLPRREVDSDFVEPICPGTMVSPEVFMKGLTGPKMSQDDPKLIEVLKKYVIEGPSHGMPKMSLPLFKTPLAEAVDAILTKKREGFFVECGALDGERSSNTIWLEQKRDWMGLLVEVDPSWYIQIRGKNRKSYSANACLSPYQYPVKMLFQEHMMGEGKLIMDKCTDCSLVHQVYCYPLYSLLLALNRTHIDYLSLDVEGLELDILRTFPFDKLDISVLTVEYRHGKNGGKEYEEFMASKGYYVHSKKRTYNTKTHYGCKDYVFVKKYYQK